MTVNKENAKKVIEYTSKVTDKWNRTGKRDKITVSVNPDSRYSFYRFAVENNLLEGSNERLNDIAIACPFHEDDSPSCNINDTMHRYHCFSCDRGGNIASFMAEYDREVLGINITYYQKVNELLVNDKEMQVELGISSIYEETDNFSLEEGLKKFTPKLNAVDIPKSYPEMASIMIKRGCSVKEIKYFILLMQAGESIVDIYKEIFGVDSVPFDNVQEYDLQQMMLDL